MASVLRLGVILQLVACANTEPTADDASTDRSDSRASTDASIEQEPSGVDATLDGGAGCASFKLCEDFESTIPGDIPMGWTKTGDVSVSGTDFYRGAQSLHIGIAPNGPRRINRTLGFLGANASDHWGRLFFKTMKPVLYNGPLHSTLVAMKGKSPVDNVDIEARVVDTVQDAQLFHNFQYDVQPSSRAEFRTASPDNWQYTSTWRCVEWHVEYATQSYSFFLDGAEVISLHIYNGPNNFAGVEIPSAYTAISVGWNNYEVVQNLNGGFEAYIDDLAIDGTRIGCEK